MASVKQNADTDATIGAQATRRAAYGTLMTLGMRLVSFACTQWTLRVLDPSTLGRASIQLELLLTSVLFMSREGFRLALTRNISEENWNVAWLSVPVATVVSSAALLWHLHIAKDEDYRFAGILFCLASLIEGCAEPAVLWELRKMNIAAKASAEGVATISKTAVLVVSLRYLQYSFPVTAFGLAQTMYAVVYAFFLYSRSWRSMRGPQLGSWDSSAIYLVAIFTGQGFFKHVLTEGDKIVLTALSGSYDQGVYAMASGYGGLAARMLLQPLEENARLLWSRQARPSKDDGQHRSLELSYTVLVKIVLYIGLIFSCLAVNYSSLLLGVLAGRKWGENAEAAAVLSAFCVYIAFLAWNGMTEAFVYAVASSGVDMRQLGIVHTVVGVLFAGMASLAVARFGAKGLVAANCVAMLLRALYSVSFAADYFAKRRGGSVISVLRRQLRATFPRPQMLVAFASCFFATQISQRRFASSVLDLSAPIMSGHWIRIAIQHVAVGVACGGGLGFIARLVETDFIRSARLLWNSRQD